MWIVLPLFRCFFLVLRHIPLTPRTGFMSLLLMGGGCRMGLGARVKHTGKPAAHIRIPVIPDACVQRTHIDTQERRKHYQWRSRVSSACIWKWRSAAWPASAGWKGPDPVRFFTGRAGTLQRKGQKDNVNTEGEVVCFIQGYFLQPSIFLHLPQRPKLQKDSGFVYTSTVCLLPHTQTHLRRRDETTRLKQQRCSMHAARFGSTFGAHV